VQTHEFKPAASSKYQDVFIESARLWGIQMPVGNKNRNFNLVEDSVDKVTHFIQPLRMPRLADT
jgi:hypothetical protein